MYQLEVYSMFMMELYAPLAPEITPELSNDAIQKTEFLVWPTKNGLGQHDWQGEAYSQEVYCYRI
jgi:hypothetical protein